MDINWKQQQIQSAPTGQLIRVIVWALFIQDKFNIIDHGLDTGRTWDEAYQQAKRGA